MLAIRDLTLSIKGQRLLEGASATVPAGHRVGVVGRNGSGKSTLFRALRGELSPELGEIETPKAWRVGGVAQEAPATGDSLLDLVLAADEERAALMAEAESAEEPHRIAEIQTRLTDIAAHSAEARAASILSGLGFEAAAQARASREFSGGWRMRVALAGALFAEPDLLLLDEPTNYLDLEGTVWLEGFLARYPRTVLVISHDRGLLNRSVGSILHLADKTLTFYGVAYDRFAEMRRERVAQTGAQAKRQQAERARIQSFVDRFRAKATKARQAQARLKMLERMEPIDAVVEESVAPFGFPDPEPLSPPLISMENAAVGYDGAPVLSSLDLRIDQEDRIALLGANGQGKSTLSKLLAGLLAPMEGRVVSSSKLRIGYFAQHQLDGLTEGENAVQHIRRLRPDEPQAKLRARLGAAGIGAAIAEAPVETLSGGQKARLLMALATLDAPHLIILDEPTNHLDIESREALMQALAAYQGAVILVSHDPYLVEAAADRLWLVQDGGVAPFDGDMEAYRRLLLSQRGSPGGQTSAAKHAKAARSGEPAMSSGVGAKPNKHAQAEKRRSLAQLRADAYACEERVKKLEAMRDLVAEKLSDPALYAGAGDTLESLGRKRAEIETGLERAEALWLEALEKLEAAEA